MSRWFRVYDDAMNDPKVQRLAPHAFKAWFNILCLANKAGNGVLPAIADIAYALRMSDTDAQATIDELILAGLIDISADKTLIPHNWSVRQLPSDNSKDRTKKWRQGKKEKAKKSEPNNGDGHGDGGVTAGDTKSDAPDKTIPDTDSDYNLAPSESTAARAKEQRVDNFRLKVKGTKKVKDDYVRARAEGLGLPVDELWEASRTAKNPPAYFTRLCINRLRDLHPIIDEQLIRDALWEKIPTRYGHLMSMIVGEVAA